MTAADSFLEVLSNIAGELRRLGRRRRRVKGACGPSLGGRPKPASADRECGGLERTPHGSIEYLSRRPPTSPRPVLPERQT
jgi:hypothetical protein